MTSVLLDEPDRWTTPPGWGIHADLSPPELLTARRVRVIRRITLIGLVVVLLVVALGCAYGLLVQQRADDAVARQQVVTASLQAEQQKYAGITTLKSNVTQVQGQLAQLMSGDVDLATLVGRIRSSAPKGVVIATVSATLNGATGTAAAATSTNSLDTSGRTQIGKLTVTGTAGNLDQVAAYVLALQKQKGITDVTPGSSSVTAGVVTYTMSASVDDSQLSHVYGTTTTTTPAAAVAK